ncbi:DUF4403 family protein [Psychroflexus sp. MES1-P1E]|uniref:DUF4403 family protein n=1 Tax=Psychroflexus sp. MES1-P1E TaxID=2058320 RepID=UPI000C79F9DC|nr:DUF4403 family protein [Psychroflexus sp. MES1-P1E]PKG41473.1 hypothetical protein CXF67_15445 [Psychroflexus sp. MES1-P1E]
MKKTIILSLIILIIASCTTVRLSQKPSPRVSNELPESKESVVYIPFSVDLSEIEKKIEEAVPKGRIFRDSDGCERDEYEVEVFRNNPMKVSTSNGKLIFTTTLKVKADVSRCPGVWQDDWFCSCCCHGGRATGHANSDIALKIEVDLRVNPDYSITANTKLDGEIISGKNIVIWVLGFKVSIPVEQVAGKITDQLKPIKKELDKEIAKQLNNIKIKDELALSWKEAHKVLPVDDFFLHVTPKNIYFKNITSNGNSINLGAGIGVKMTINNDSTKTPVTSLPSLTISNNPHGFFFINLPIDASFDYVSNKLTETYKNEKYEYGNNWVKIKNIKLYGVDINESARGLLVDVEINGKISLFKRVKGHIYFTAKPSIDTEKTIAYLDDFKMNSNTSSEIINKGVEFLINKFYYEDISKSSLYNYSSDIVSMEQMIRKELKDLQVGNYKLKLDLDKVNINGLYITNEVIGIDSEINGSIQTIKLK